MTAILSIIVPVFGTVAVGWLLGRSTLLSSEGLRGLTNVTFYALFPSLLFRSMSKVRIEALSFDILFVFFGTSVLLFFASLLLVRLLGMTLAEGAVFALSAVFSNGVGIGIPFISYAFGDAGLVPLLMIISLNSLITLTLASFVIEISQQTGTRASLLGKLGGTVVKMLRHPIIPSIFAGLLWGELCHLVPGLGTPVVIDRILQALATAAPPCGLIMAGASLAHVGLKGHWQAASAATVLKLALMPLVVWMSGHWLFHLEPLWLTVATLNAAMPAGANVYLIAQLYRTGVGLATNAVVLSTGASVATLAITLLLLGVQPG